MPGTVGLGPGWELTILLSRQHGRHQPRRKQVNRSGGVVASGFIEQIGDEEFARIEMLNHQPPAATRSLNCLSRE